VQESRLQESWTAAPEKRTLLWLASRTPSRIGPDHLTVLGLVSQVGAGVGWEIPWTVLWPGCATASGRGMDSTSTIWSIVSVRSG
jgi:hypothetical protein